MMNFGRLRCCIKNKDCRGRIHYSAALWLDVCTVVAVGVTQSVKSDTSQRNAVCCKGTFNNITYLCQTNTKKTRCIFKRKGFFLRSCIFIKREKKQSDIADFHPHTCILLFRFSHVPKSTTPSKRLFFFFYPLIPVSSLNLILQFFCQPSHYLLFLSSPRYHLTDPPLPAFLFSTLSLTALGS